MADRLVTQSDNLLIKLDKRVGIDAELVIVGEPVLDIETGLQAANDTTIPDVRVRNISLSIRELTEVTDAGLSQVEKVFRMRKFYANELKTDDRLKLIPTGFEYLILRPDLDDLEIQWTLFTRRLRI